MRGKPTAQATFAILRAFVACWYTRVLQLHTRLQVGHCSIKSFYALHYALSHDTPLWS